MTIDPRLRAAALGYDLTYAEARAAEQDDREMRRFLHRMGATHFYRHPDGRILAYDGYGREREIAPPRRTWARWHCERGQNWRPGVMPEGAEAV